MSNKLPLLGFLSEPGMFDPIAIWGEFLAEVQAMPDFVWKESVIENAKWVIAQKRQMLRARLYGVEWLHSERCCASQYWSYRSSEEEESP